MGLSFTISNRSFGAEPDRQIHRCIEFLTTTARPHGRARVVELGPLMRRRTGLHQASHAIVMMEQKTSHNYLLLVKPLAISHLTGLGRKSLHVTPAELVLVDLSRDERAVFWEESIEVGSVSLNAPQRGVDVRPEVDPLFPGSLVSIDQRFYVAVQVMNESTYLTGERVRHSSSYMLAELPAKPTAGVVGTVLHTLRVELDHAPELNDTSCGRVINVGQASVVATVLINAIDGPQLKVELLEVLPEQQKAADASEIVVRCFKSGARREPCER